MASPFVAVGTAATDQAVITNDAFWPGIDPDDCRAVMKLDGSAADPRLRAALIGAIGDANRQLTAWATAQAAAGYPTLASVPAPQIDGGSLKVHQYRQAVYHLATAELTEYIRSIDTSRQGNAAADVLETPIDTHRRTAHWLLNDIRGNPRTTVELI